RDLLELRHQPFAGMQTPRGVDDQHVGATCDCRVDGVERHSGGIRTGDGTDELRAGALGPHPQLIDRAGAEGVARRYGDALPLTAELRGELADEGRLAGAVHADDEDDGR